MSKESSSRPGPELPSILGFVMLERVDYDFESGEYVPQGDWIAFRVSQVSYIEFPAHHLNTAFVYGYSNNETDYVAISRSTLLEAFPASRPTRPPSGGRQ